jgi:hypothetical protein
MVVEIKQQPDLEALKSSILPILKQHRISKAGIFGSLATGTAKKTSDLDLLVEFGKKKSLFDLISLKLDLEAELNRNVDILTYQSLSPLIKKIVLAQEVRIL